MDLIPVNQARSVGQLANEYAASSVFQDYQTRVTANTLRRQKADLDLFAQCLELTGLVPGDLMTDPRAWSEVTHGLVDFFVRWQLSQGYAVGSVNVRLATVKQYCSLATRAGIISSQDYAMIKLVSGYRRKEGRNVDQKREVTRVGDKKSQAVSINPKQAIELKRQPDTPQGRRDALLMSLLLDHGLRCGEVASLTVDCLNLSEATIHFYRPKVDKTQTHNLTKDSLLAAIRYLEVAKPTDKLLMGSRKGGKLEGNMSERAITDRVKVLGELVGLQGLSAHDCRHYWATQAAKHGTDIKSLQQAGGWSSPAMPLRYAEDATIANEGVKLQ